MCKNHVAKRLKNQIRVALTTIDGVTRVINTEDIKLEEECIICKKPILRIDYDHISHIEPLWSKEQEDLTQSLEYHKLHEVPIIVVGEEFQLKGKIVSYSSKAVVINLKFDFITIPFSKITSIY